MANPYHIRTQEKQNNIELAYQAIAKAKEGITCTELKKRIGKSEQTTRGYCRSLVQQNRIQLTVISPCKKLYHLPK